MTIGVAFFGGLTSGPVTWNPSDKAASLSLSSGNLVVTKGGSDSYGTVRATKGISASENGYFEVYISEGTQSQYIMVGVGNSSMLLTASVGSASGGYAYYQGDGNKWNNGSSSAYGNNFLVNGTVIGVAFKNGKVWFAKNNTWQNSGDPAAGTGEAFSGITGTVYPAASLYRATAPSHVIGGRFKSSDFSYSPPSGFAAWGS